MSRYRLDLASRDDDAALRQVLAETPMKGAVSVGFRREPSYFQAAVVDGEFRQTVTASEVSSGTLVGCGSRSVRTRYFNGRKEPIGYLSTLRILPAHRKGTLVARGFAYFRELHQDGRALFYLTMIAAGNAQATETLTRGRAGLPKYHPIGDYQTSLIPIPQRARSFRVPAGITLRSASACDVISILSFLHESGPARQFFPTYSECDFFNPDGTFRDLNAEDIVLAIRDGKIIGTLALWNQCSFRQVVVEEYGQPLRWTRRIYNLLASISARPRLPNVKQPLRQLTAALPVVANDDPQVFHALISAAINNAAGGSSDHLMLGLHVADPLLVVVRQFRTACYTTRAYIVCWEDGEELLAEIDNRPPYLELGTL